MIFPRYNYKEYNITNKHLWPCSDWNKMINENDKYCIEMGYLGWIKFYFYRLTGRIKKSDLVFLPSCHKYWLREVIRDRKSAIKSAKDLYEEFVKNPNHLKFKRKEPIRKDSFELGIKDMEDDLKTLIKRFKFTGKK